VQPTVATTYGRLTASPASASARCAAGAEFASSRKFCFMREHDLPHLLVLDKNMRIVDTVRMRDLTLGDEDCHNPEDSKISIANPQKMLHWRNSP
jgi:hypothetical protein